ncbi:hypothetical protein SK128_003849 [Halocaridina rubra]|uniref:SprT-like domain-containing protein n=1 Tax=Halocaridina rubra TaxID=373956 RepID=A0AAN8WRA0_HALRR
MTYSQILASFDKYNAKYFEGKLNDVRLNWDGGMTQYPGNTTIRVKKKSGPKICIHLSKVLLSQRPYKDIKNTLLHEMIHAYLYVTEGLTLHDSHGRKFKGLMRKINSFERTKITIFHDLPKGVDDLRIHVYKCDGPCVSERPKFGILKREIERPPGPKDKWWARHSYQCGGTFHKISGPGAESNSSEWILERKFEEFFKARSSYGKPSPVCEYVEGNVNYNYKPHSYWINVGKYLKRYYETKYATNFPSLSQNSDSITSIDNKRIPGRKLYSTDKMMPLTDKEISDGGERTEFNYTYVSKTPDKIKLSKYINRYHSTENVSWSKYHNYVPQSSSFSSARGSCSTVVTTKPGGFLPLNTKPSKVKDKNVALHIGTSETVVCPMCNIHIHSDNLEKHINACLGSDFDSEFDDESESQPPKSCVKGENKVQTISQFLDNSSTTSNELISDNKTMPRDTCHMEQLEVRDCPNCGSKVRGSEMGWHIQYCIDWDWDP